MTDAVTNAAPAAPADATSATAALTSAAPAAAVSAPAATAPAPADGTTAPAPAPAAETLAMPGKDATPEQWAEFYGKLGRPESPEGYELPVAEGDDGTFAKEVSPLLHKAGVSATQAKVLAEGWNQMRADALAKIATAEAESARAAEAKNQAEAATLQREWGAQHTENMEFARRAVTQFLPKENAGDVIAAIESKIGYAETIKLMNKIGKGLSEHDAAGLGASNAGAAQVKSIGERLYGGSGG